LTGYVSGAMPTNERSRNLQALGQIEANQRYVLSNARCLSEGVDVPALDGVAFIDPRNSEIDIVQAVGRAIRLSKGKAIGSIVIPVFIEDHDDPDEVINSSPFKKVWAVVNALRSHDGELGEQLDQLRQVLGKRGTVGKPDKIVFDLPTTITDDFATSLNTKLIESTTASWEFWFGLLEKYKVEFGDCLVKNVFQYGDYKLASWVAVQRKNQDTLAHEKVGRLDDLGFVWDPREAQWEEGFNHLASYQKELGDCWVNVGSLYRDFNLGQWVSNQRAYKHRLTSLQISRLDGLDFIWHVLKFQWEKGFNHLVAYKEEFGDCKVRLEGEYNGYQLRSWVGTQRVTKDKLTFEQVSRLDRLGFVWKAHVETWEEGFQYLVAYQEEFGDCLVVDKSIYQHFTLGTWVSTQRSKEGKLTSKQLSRLNKLGFIWDARENLWEEGYKHLVAYKGEFGDCLVVIKGQYCNYNLGTWVSNQRVKEDTLAPERLNRLNKIGFVWNILEYKWEEGFKCLAAYKEEHGDCLVKSSSQYRDYRLGGWVGRQRTNQDKLTLEQIKRLDTLGFVWKTRKKE